MKNHRPSLSESKARIIRHLEVVRKRNGGTIPTLFLEEAAKQLGRSPRTVRRWMTEAPRRRGSRLRFVLKMEHKKVLMECHGDCTAAVRRCKELGIEAPSVRTMQRAWQGLSAFERAYLSGGPMAARPKKMVVSREKVGRGQVLEADHKCVDALVLLPRGHTAVRPWLTVFVCASTKVIMGICVSLRPTQSDVLAAMGASFARNPVLSPGYGIPEEIRVDRGMEFMARSVAEAAALFGVVVTPNWPYHPEHKGSIERLFLTMKMELFRDLPHATFGPQGLDGSMVLSKDMEPISYKLFVELVMLWVSRYNYKRIHSSLKKSPADAWAADPTIIDEASDEDLRRFLRRDIGTRVVSSRGVFANSRWYQAPFLMPYVDQEVEVRDVPHDVREVSIFVDGNYLGCAVPQDDMTEEQRNEVLHTRRSEVQKAAAVQRQLVKESEARFAGMVAVGEPEEITDLPPDVVSSLMDTDAEDAAKLAKERQARKKARGKQDADKSIEDNPFFGGRDERGGLQ